MLQRLLLKQPNLRNIIRYSAGQVKSHEHEHEPTKKATMTKEDLKYFEYFMTMEKPNQEETKFSPSQIIQRIKLSPSYFEFLSKAFSTPDSEALSDNYIPPKVHQNSVFIYESRKLAQQFRFVRSCDYIFAFFLLGVTSYPLFALSTAAAAYVVGFNAFAYEPSRRLVVRMDILPHNHCINFVRIGSFGKLYNKIVRIEDLEYVEYEELQDKENYFWAMQYPQFDAQLIFRDKITKELFLFDRKAVWNQEGLEHQLIN